MHVVRHQTISQQREPIQLCILTQQCQVSQAIGIAGENHLSRIPSLGNMMGNANHDNARETSHTEKIPEMLRALVDRGRVFALPFPEWYETIGVRSVCPRFPRRKGRATRHWFSN